MKTLPGILDTRLDMNMHTATVTYDPGKITLEKILDALAKGGYPINGTPKFLN